MQMLMAIQKEEFCVPSGESLDVPRTVKARPAFTRTGAPGMFAGRNSFWQSGTTIEDNCRTCMIAGEKARKFKLEVHLLWQGPGVTERLSDSDR